MGRPQDIAALNPIFEGWLLQDLGWHDEAARDGVGVHWLTPVPTPVPLQVYAMDVAVFVPPPTTYPAAHVAVTDAPVLPLNVPPVVTPLANV